MYHSFVDRKDFNDNEESSIELIFELVVLFNDPLEVSYVSSAKLVKPNITIRSHAQDIYKSLLSISCFHRACVLYKK